MNSIKLYPAQIWCRNLAIACLIALFIAAIKQIPVADHSHPHAEAVAPGIQCTKGHGNWECINEDGQIWFLSTEATYETSH